MPAPAVRWSEARIWASIPPGASIQADASGVVVRAPQPLLGLKIRRPDPIVLIDEAVLVLFGPDGARETVMAVAAARAWAVGGKLTTSSGEVAIGEQLAAAWDYHVDAWRAEQRRATLVAVPS